MARTARSTERRGIQSIDFVGTVLNGLAFSKGPIALKELSALTDVPPSKLHRYLASLVRIGLAVQRAEDSRYDLGPMALRLGLAAMGRRRIIDEAEDALKSVLDRFALTGHLSIWSDHGPVIVRTHHGGAPLVTSLGLGRTLPLTQSATGLVYLALLPATATKDLAPRIDAATKAAIGRIRAHGISAVKGTLIPGLAAIAVPVFDFDGALACVMTATLPAERMKGEPASSPIAIALKGAAMILDVRAELAPALVERRTRGR